MIPYNSYRAKDMFMHDREMESTRYDSALLRQQMAEYEWFLFEIAFPEFVVRDEVVVQTLETKEWD
jgi:hypothetical protein